MAKKGTFSKRRRKPRPRLHDSRIGSVAFFLLLTLVLVVTRLLWPPNSTTFQLRKNADNAKQSPQLISRRGDVQISADVRGNLGSASVLNQDPPGTDWIKDRWQAASDMHGTAIQGAHWVMMEFPSRIAASYVILDWEAAFSKDYQIEIQNDKDEWTVVFDTNKDSYQSREHGQSPGVKTKTPLHIVHNITLTPSFSFTRLRVWIRSSAMGWGVSLWQVDVYGYAGDK